MQILTFKSLNSPSILDESGYILSKLKKNHKGSAERLRAYFCLAFAGDNIKAMFN